MTDSRFLQGKPLRSIWGGEFRAARATSFETLTPPERRWAFTFPLGSLTLLTYSLGTTFDSLFFK